MKDKKSRSEFATIQDQLDLYSTATPQQHTGRNVIAFSLWGDGFMYLQGAIENVTLAKAIYPGWQCRFYHDASVPENALDSLRKLKVELVAVDGALANLHGGLWRFAVANDPAVDRFIIRDADSRLNERDAAAVKAWSASGKSFHIMRDHIKHTDLILAGMWGGRAGMLSDLTAMANALYGGHVSRWNDQLFLARAVWPLVRDDCLIHDSFYHQGFRGDPFPISPARTEKNFIGLGIKIKGKSTTAKFRKGQKKIKITL